jgi:predicted ester cyclase
MRFARASSTSTERKTMAVAHITDYERVWTEGLNRGDVSVADDVFTSDCIIHLTGVAEPIKGVEAWKQVIRGLLTAIPDIRFTIDEELVVGDKVAFRWRARGTHNGPLGPVPPTGRSVDIEGLIVDHLKDGKVAERWEQYDQSLMLQQLGLQ